MVKEVKENHKSKRSTSKLNFYFALIQKLKEGKTTTDISEELNTSKQNIYYYTTELRKLGFIRKVGYGVWEVLRSKKEDLEHAISKKGKEIRGHAFIWKVKPGKSYNWKEVLDKREINYKLVRGSIPRIFINDKKVWLSKDSIIVYENKSFYGKNAIESRKYAVNDLLEVLRAFSNKIGLSLGKPIFKPVREHYGMIKNELAQQYTRNGEKLVVNDDLDGEWLWVDDSTGMLGEYETGGKGVTKDRAGLNKNVQDWYNDHKKHNFQVTPSFVLKGLNEVKEIQQMHAENIVSHHKVLNKMGKTQEKTQETLDCLKNEIKELKNEIRNLRK